MNKINEVIKKTEKRIEQIKADTSAELAELNERKKTAQKQSEQAYTEMKAAATNGDTKLYIAKRAERDSAEAVVEMCNMRTDDLTSGALISNDEYNSMVGTLLEAMEAEDNRLRAEAAAFFDKAEADRVQLLDKCTTGNKVLKQLYEVNNKQGGLSKYDRHIKTGYMIAAMISRGDVMEVRKEQANGSK